MKLGCEDRLGGVHGALVGEVVLVDEQGLPARGQGLVVHSVPMIRLRVRCFDRVRVRCFVVSGVRVTVRVIFLSMRSGDRKIRESNSGC